MTPEAIKEANRRLALLSYISYKGEHDYDLDSWLCDAHVNTCEVIIHDGVKESDRFWLVDRMVEDERKDCALLSDYIDQSLYLDSDSVAEAEE